MCYNMCYPKQQCSITLSSFYPSTPPRPYLSIPTANTTHTTTPARWDHSRLFREEHKKTFFDPAACLGFSISSDCLPRLLVWSGLAQSCYYNWPLFRYFQRFYYDEKQTTAQHSRRQPQQGRNKSATAVPAEPG